jgi:predicted metal-dependent phosphoesterase TrpH
MRPHHPSVLRADLHVHSCHSVQSGNLKFLKSRDCYSRPDDVYRTAKARGMDLVTITDHDSIAGCLEFLDGHPDARDFFVSEEVSCGFPDADIEVHLGVYGMTERLHRDLQGSRDNVFEVVAALREAGVFFALNHLLHFYRGQISLAAYLKLLDEVPALETRNGTMLPAHNALAAKIASVWPRNRGGILAPLGAVGGSDAHTLRRIGRTWTEAPGTTADEFLAALAAGKGQAAGSHGTARAVAGDAYGVIGSYIASLIGRGPRDHAAWQRAACLIFCAVSAPAQFMPMVIAAAGKVGERRRVESAASELAVRLAQSALPPAALEAGS